MFYVLMDSFPSTKPYEIIVGVPFVLTTVCSIPLFSRFLHSNNLFYLNGSYPSYISFYNIQINSFRVFDSMFIY